MAYCTIEELYEYADLDNDALDPKVMQRFVDLAYAQINQFTGTFYSTTVDGCTTITESLDPTPLTTDVGESYLVFNKYPIQYLSTISINGSSYATTNFVVYDDRIKISTSATSISSFGTYPKNVSVVYKYGLIDSEQFNVAKQLNICMALLDFLNTPKGRNVYMDNSRYAEINHNDVRPNDMVETYIAQLRERVNDLKAMLGVAHRFF